MRYNADLHTHTTASDGQYTPQQLVYLAQTAGVEYIAITDHDTTAGLDEGVQTGSKVGISVVRGVELGAKEDRHLHILGLGFRAEHPTLDALCRTLQAGRAERNDRIVSYLREKGVDVTLAEAEALAGGKIVSRPHFAQVMLRRGYVSSLREAFERYLDTEEYQKIERLKAEAKDCIAAIHADGGKAVLAHPYQLGYPDENLEHLLAQLKAFGLDALECYYPKHTQAQTAYYLKLAKIYELYITGGSDFHGEQVKPHVSLMPAKLELGWL